MKSADFDYQLPEHLIAQKPLKQRQSSRLLVLDPNQQDIVDDNFANFESCVEAGDLLVLNDTRVFPARLFGQKETGGKIEVLVERLIDDSTLLAHVRSSK